VQKFTVFEGVVAPLRRSNVDTDQIIPAVYLKRITKSGYEDGLFANWRQDPEFVLNQPGYQGAEVLITGPDFGTGSSREHAVWALSDFGFRAVFGPKFGDIFRGNCGKMGMLAGVISEADTEALWAQAEANPGVTATVDLPAQELRLNDLTVPFEIDEYTKWRLIEGLDDIGITMQHEAVITEFEAKREAWRPKTLPAKGV
jgi:3-isopropylmalate/(R)-2-methylmalate dehydratase small subunit